MLHDQRNGEKHTLHEKGTLSRKRKFYAMLYEYKKGCKTDFSKHQ